MQFSGKPPVLEKKVLWLALTAGAPAVIATAVLLWAGDYTPRLQWTVMGVVVLCWLGFSFALKERVVFPLRTLSNLLAALREGDYSLRGRASKDDALGEVMVEVNLMSRMLREQRLSALEATQLLRKVMQEIDVAIFTFDSDDRLRLVNRRGEVLLGQSGKKLLGRTAAELGLADLLDEDAGRAAPRTFPNQSGRWRVSRIAFREDGAPHQLLVLSDVSRELRAEELAAWQRLVRVLSHELNNSLAPVKSLAGSMRTLLDQEKPPVDWRADMNEGLATIESRVDALSRFTGEYARLARLPEPTLEAVRVRDCVRRVGTLETRMAIGIEEGPDLAVDADLAQLEQALINLVRNGADAALETGGQVRMGWDADDTRLTIWIADEGLGVSSEANLFVPFFTTKPGGSGIGLVLSRRVAENHGGTLTLTNRTDRVGCIARLSLPRPATGTR
ncbi:MAG: ATP-binding protein [Acidobacteria bacterium]|nr:ATP-binding protein [Acidobacteriota bacterium]MDA1235272.1 ATP-binding protein [Acidobacteriota bacterium]